MTFCNIIPDHILKKIGDKKTLQISKRLRQLREERLQQQDLTIPDPAPHNEVRALYDAKGSLSTGTLIQVDKQHHSSEPSTSPELQLFNINYDFIHDILQRESYDNKNAVMKIFKNVGKQFNNAFWDGERFAFGNGDQQIFRTFFTQNIASHECFHAVTEYVAGLVYKGQPGALNESISDVFAASIDQMLLNQKPDIADWIIGAGVFTDNINAKGLRSFKDEPAYDDPIIGTDIQPKHMEDYVVTRQDNGGVHINSGILNHAFYNFCMLTEEYSWQMPLNVWYNALSISRPDTNFVEFANYTMMVCLPEYQDKLKQSWLNVGITPTARIKQNRIIAFIKHIIFLISRIFSSFNKS